MSKRREGRMAWVLSRNRIEQSAVAKIIKMIWRPDARVKGTHDTNGDTLLAPNAKIL